MSASTAAGKGTSVPKNSRLRKRFPQFLTAAEIDATYGTKERERAARRGRDDDAVVGVLDDVVDRDLG